MNVKLLRKVEKFLLAEPRRFDMSDWISFSSVADVLKEPPCGTACCIAGATYIVAEKQDPQVARDTAEDVWKRAEEFLGIDYDESSRLFFTSDWPEKFQKKYLAAKTPLQRAKVGVARIEHFIKTKGAE